MRHHEDACLLGMLEHMVGTANPVEAPAHGYEFRDELDTLHVYDTHEMVNGQDIAAPSNAQSSGNGLTAA